MKYDAELNFTRKILKSFRLKNYLITNDTAELTHIDMGLRKLLGLEEEYYISRDIFAQKIQSNVIYKMTDIFYCNYIFIRLPDVSENITLVIGPYTTTEISRNILMEFTEQYSIPTQLFNTLEKYFNNIPYLESDNSLLVLLNTFGEAVWGSATSFTFETLDPDPVSQQFPAGFTISPEEQTDALINMKAVEERYAVENQLLQAISQGLTHKVEMLVGSFSVSQYEKRAVDPIRNMQNYCIIMNTLLRKAVENGSVHPFYIDRLSSDFGRKIEQITSIDSAKKLQRDMIHKYCLLVKNHSMQGYSLLVQKVITCIDTDLTADLTLNTIASNMNVNASYLSTLFKRETGNTLTEYVNEKRIQHGILLLHSTSLQIQTIASYCGIPDVNYFTKLFKKKVGKTPKEYRENFLKGSKKK